VDESGIISLTGRARNRPQRKSDSFVVSTNRPNICPAGSVWFDLTLFQIPQGSDRNHVLSSCRTKDYQYISQAGRKNLEQDGGR
jgi:hypothetical protein